MKPMIAAVSGHAVAGGLELSLLCDLRILEEDAVMGVFCRRFGKNWSTCQILINHSLKYVHIAATTSLAVYKVNSVIFLFQNFVNRYLIKSDTFNLLGKSFR